MYYCVNISLQWSFSKSMNCIHVYITYHIYQYNELVMSLNHTIGYFQFCKSEIQNLQMYF